MTEYQEYDAPERFVIDSDRKAEWAVKRIKEIAADKQKWLDFYAARIEAVIDECDYSAANLTELLRQYFLTLDAAKETKTQFSYELPSGKLVLKKAKTEFKVTDEPALMSAIASYGAAMEDTYIKKTVTRKPKWAEIKKNLVEADGSVVLVNDMGEAMTLGGVELVETPERFEVK